MLGVIHELCASAKGGAGRQGGNCLSPDSHRLGPLAGVFAVYYVVCNVHEVGSHVVFIAHKFLYLHVQLCACPSSAVLTFLRGSQYATSEHCLSPVS